MLAKEFENPFYRLEILLFLRLLPHAKCALASPAVLARESIIVKEFESKVI